jgi:hypothetical protein
MYISVLDFLEELKKKFYIIIVFIALFYFLSFSFQLYKQKSVTFSAEINVIKLSTLQFKGNILEKLPSNISQWIANEAEKKYVEIKKDNQVHMECKVKSKTYFLICEIKENSPEDIKLIEDQMFKSINNSFDEYKLYYTEIVDQLIKMNQELHAYIVNSSDTDIEAKASSKSKLENLILNKTIFMSTIDDSKLDRSDIVTQRYEDNANYLLVFLSAIICGLFVIFLQMRTKNS